MPAAALAQAPAPLQSPAVNQVPHRRPLPTPSPRRFPTPLPRRTMPSQPSHRPGASPYQTRVLLNSDDVKHILATPSAPPTPVREPNSIKVLGVPSPDVFGTPHT